MIPGVCQKMIGCALLVGWLFVGTGPVLALEPAEVAVIANVRSADSLALAEHYLQARRIPADHLIRIDTATDERCTRAVYETEIQRPVRAALSELLTRQRIRCLVVLFGVPLAIEPVAAVEEEEAVAELRRKIGVLTREQEGAKTPRLEAIEQERRQLEQQLTRLQAMGDQAAVDSELALVLSGEYPLAGWLPNPYFLGFQRQATRLNKDEVLIVGRLDGPNLTTARRLIDDSLWAEREGLQGRACFDARWPRPVATGLQGYALYDAALHAAAESLRASGRMASVRLDANEALFQPGDCPGTALYSGWYSLGRYVGAFTWARGAIGYHIASGECITLKRPEEQGWCKRLLEEGAAATIGPVNEPYVQAFPLPDLFFSTLADGYLSLGETYLITLPFLSWQMILIGDPLYQPFRPR